MGNPHAVQWVDDVDAAPVLQTGPLIENHPRFAQRVNAGFAQIVDRSHVRLRVYERGAGETLACGTGACAAVVAGIRLGLLDAQAPVQVDMRGTQVTRNLQGQPSTHDALVRAWQVKAAPTVLFLGPGGQEVADRLVGGSPDFYSAYLDGRLERARQALGK